jgi:heptosyltransferase III
VSDLSKRIERHLKRAIFGSMAGTGDSRALKPSGVDLDRVRKVLVVRPNFRMGNLLLLTPGLAALRARLPRARIDVIGSGKYLSLLEHNPDVDDSIWVGRHTFTPWLLLRLARQLRVAAYDLTIDGARGGSFLGASIVGLSRSRYRVASANSRYCRFFNVLVPPRDGSRHKVELLLDFLEGIGVPRVSAAIKVVLSEDEVRAAEVLWATIGAGSCGLTAGINVGARGDKRLDAEQLLALAHGLSAAGIGTILFAGPQDGAILAELGSRLPAGSVVAPPLPVRAFAAMLARCNVVVTGDTGPMHLAAAVGTSTVTLVVDSRSTFYAPLGAQHQVVVGNRSATVSQVLAAVRALTTCARAQRRA